MPTLRSRQVVPNFDILATLILGLSDFSGMYTGFI